MKLLPVLIFLCITKFSFSQDTLRIYRWESIQKANPDTIYGIDASKLKWEEVPEKLYSFKNVKYLNISKNKLKELPLEMGVFKSLKTLDATKNDLENAPIVICQMPKLQKFM